MFGADRPYNVTVKDPLGRTISQITNVSLNTAFVALPHMITDALVMGYGKPEWPTEWGSEQEIRDGAEKWFARSVTWFNEWADNGESEILGLYIS